jgi:hypothetical protein
VGGCARGFDPAANTTADIIYTNGDMQRPGTAAAVAAASSSNSSSGQQGQLQYFWEAFPAADGFLGQPKGGQQQSVKAGEWKSDARTTYMFSYMDAQVSWVWQVWVIVYEFCWLCQLPRMATAAL